MDVIKQDDISISDIVSALKKGKTIVYPTETCYGLGCDALNPVAVEKIFEIKKRQRNKSVLVVAHDESMIMDYVVWTNELQELAERYWPGPLTVVAEVNPGVELPAGVMADDGTLAFRITDYPLARELSDKLGHPLVSTSANIASLASPYDIASVLSMFDSQEHTPDIVIDAGTLPHKSPSTVVRVQNGTYEILRQGELIIEL